ncbi:MAG: TetR/AcrR family transcriptional regulator [Solirubrobacterales bacterium]
MSAAPQATRDRAADVRRALRSLVAPGGFHGAAMSAVAQEAGVATGTAYTYYSSKEELVVATYVETKTEMGDAAMQAADPGLAPEQRFTAVWLAIYRHLKEDPDRARFLVQLESSPYLEKAREAPLGENGGALTEIVTEPGMAALLVDLPPQILYELGVAPAVRLVAAGTKATPAELQRAAGGCWRAITRPR